MAAFVFSNGASSKLNSARIFAQPMDKKIYLKPRKEESLLRQHPWVFSGAIKRMEGQPVTGDLGGVREQRQDAGLWALQRPYIHRGANALFRC